MAVRVKIFSNGRKTRTRRRRREREKKERKRIHIERGFGQVSQQ